MKKLQRNSIHENYRSHDCMLNDHNDVKVKITYESYNGVERCTTEVFNGTEFNTVLNMMDLGVVPNTSAYNIWDNDKRKKRADDLFDLSVKMCLKILNK